MDIWFFSGTGNSRRVAQDLAHELGAGLKDIARADGIVTSNADALGIVFPVYFEALPEVIVQFVRRLHAPDAKHIFAVCTYGGAAGMAVKQLRHELKLAGLKLNAAYGVHMPQNSFTKPNENRYKLLTEWQRRLPVVAARVMMRKNGSRFFSLPVESVVCLLYPVLIRPAVVRQLARLSGLAQNAPMGQLINHADASYTVSGDCNGCGLCAAECPVVNIVMDGGAPVWGGRCELCTRCYNICPQRAIAGGVVEKGFYFEPECMAHSMDIISNE